MPRPSPPPSHENAPPQLQSLEKRAAVGHADGWDAPSLDVVLPGLGREGEGHRRWGWRQSHCGVEAGEGATAAAPDLDGTRERKGNDVIWPRIGD